MVGRKKNNTLWSWAALSQLRVEHIFLHYPAMCLLLFNMKRNTNTAMNNERKFIAVSNISLNILFATWRCIYVGYALTFAVTWTYSSFQSTRERGTGLVMNAVCRFCLFSVQCSAAPVVKFADMDYPKTYVYTVSTSVSPYI